MEGAKGTSRTPASKAAAVPFTPVAVAEPPHRFQDGPGLPLDELRLPEEFLGHGRLLVLEHAHGLSCRLEPLGVRLLRRDTHGLVRRLHDHLFGSRENRGGASPGDHGKRPWLRPRESLHPLVEDRCEVIALEAFTAEVLFGKFLQGPYGGRILDEVPALAVA